jgi:hypothetical protein
LRAAIAEAQRYGVTSVQVAGASLEDLDLYGEAARAGGLQVRVYAALSTPASPDDAAFEQLDNLKRKYADSPLFKSGALKVAVDGVIEAHTAAMLAPYVNRTDGGESFIAPDHLNRFVRLADARGWQILTHAIGDRAVRMALDAYAHAVRSNPLPARGRRHRVEHAESVASADVPRFGALGVIASMQPVHRSPDPAAQIDVWTRNVGEERASRGWPYRAIARAGARLAFGSDWPVAPLNPMLGIHTAVNRTTPDGAPEARNPGQRIAIETAIRAYTSGSAWASFDEQRKGTLEPGMLADIVILSRNVLGPKAQPADLASTRAVVTVFDGKVVYRRDRAGTN